MKGRLQAIPFFGRFFSRTEIRPDEVRRFWSFMQVHYITSVVDKQNATEMKLVAYALEKLGIVDCDAFMKRFATTIRRHIYLPFTVGVPAGNSNRLWNFDTWLDTILGARSHTLEIKISPSTVVTLRKDGSP